jgi:penicillin-binding protein 1B
MMIKRAYIYFIVKSVILFFVLSSVAAGIGLSVYSWQLSQQIHKRFSTRRWSIPSTIFSDITIIYPGQQIDQNFFIEKLKNIGYRAVANPPLHKGEFTLVALGIDIFLNDLDVPSLKRKGVPISIKFSEGRIETIVRTDTKEPQPILELEPEKLMLFFGPEREQRQLVSINDVPKHLVFAVLAAEDKNFFKHIGVSPMGMVRALYTNLRHGGVRQGGSTLTQQLTKNYFLTSDRTISRKLQGILTSMILELMYEKDEILEIYLNEIYFGQKGSVSVNGVGEASKFYFGKPVSRLSLTEAATIAGLIKAPNQYSPYRNQERSLARRNSVLKAMNKNGWLDKKKLNEALKMPVITSGFRVYGRKAPYFMDYLAKQLAELYPLEVLSGHGLSIYTALDTQVQAAAEQALENGLARLEMLNPAIRRIEPEKKLQGAIVVMQPKTGHILAMVGGREYGVSQFNRAVQSLRQPGSAFKPFVYLSGLDLFTPATMLSNEPRSYTIEGSVWQPRNFSPTSDNLVTMRTALKKSHNIATVDLAMKVGLDRIVDTTAGFKFSTPLSAYPSLALGALEVIPIELARAFCVFASDGLLPYPLSLKEVVDEKRELLEGRHMSIERVTSPAKAFIISSMLQSVVTEGTASSLKEMGVTVPVAGKTGTTNNYRDAWFIGYTPDILALVWVGFDNGDPIFATGSGAALPIWADLINAIPDHVSKRGFKMPPGVVKYVICLDSGEPAIQNRCMETAEEYCLKENVPPYRCQIHAGPFERVVKGVKDLLKLH